SICKKGLVTRSNNHLSITNQEIKTQPIFHTQEDFLKFLSQELDPNISHLALNFAYPLSPFIRDGKLDGTLLLGTKENIFEGLLGKNVGEEIEKYIFEKKARKIQ